MLNFDTMTPEQFVNARKVVGGTSEALAKYLGVTPSRATQTFSDWGRGVRKMDPARARLMHMLVFGISAPDWPVKIFRQHVKVEAAKLSYGGVGRYCRVLMEIDENNAISLRAEDVSLYTKTLTEPDFRWAHYPCEADGEIGAIDVQKLKEFALLIEPLAAIIDKHRTFSFNPEGGGFKAEINNPVGQAAMEIVKEAFHEYMANSNIWSFIKAE